MLCTNDQRYDLVLHSRAAGLVLVRSTSPHADDFTSQPSRPLHEASFSVVRFGSRGIQTSSSLESTAVSSSPFHASPAISRTGNTSGERCESSHVLRSRAGVSSTRSARRQFRFVAAASALLDVRQCRRCLVSCLR